MSYNIKIQLSRLLCFRWATRDTIADDRYESRNEGLTHVMFHARRMLRIAQLRILLFVILH